MTNDEIRMTNNQEPPRTSFVILISSFWFPPYHPLMPAPPLYAPWRIDYIRSLDKPDAGECFLCAAAKATTDQEKRDRLVLWTTPHSIVMINRFPYTNGHLLVSPIAHIADLDDIPDEVAIDLHRQTARAMKLLRKAISPQGFNLGTNIGRCAGAGLPGHIHQHVVPRWAGDTNFMSVVGEIRVVPQAMTQLYDELMRVHAAMSGVNSNKL
jgi:ATP adenylyltransferase